MSATPHVLHVGLESPAYRVGGLNRYLDELVRAERTAGWRAEVVWIATAPQVDAIAVAPGLTWPRRLRAFARAIRHSKASVIDVHFPAHAAWALASGALRGRPLVVHFQGPWSLESATEGEGRFAVWLKRRLEGYVLRRADEVVTLSVAFKELALERYGVAAHRASVVAPGVAVADSTTPDAARAALGLSVDREVWLMVRRLVSRMGHDLALAALAQHPSPRPLLVIVGEGPHQGAVADRARALGLEGDVRFAGRVDDDELAAWYAAADVSLVPSVAHEGFGLVVLESLAAGTPVVASDLEGLRDAARDTAAVRLCAPEPGAIIEAVSAVVGQPALRAVARTTAERYRWEHVADTHLALYRGALRGDRAHSVVFLDHTAAMSGGELALARLLSGIGDGWRPHVLVAEPGPFVDELRRRGISVEVLPFRDRTRALAREAVGGRGSGTAAWDTVVYARHVRRRLRRLRPDIVHTNSLKAHVYGAAASALAPWRTVLHVRDRWRAPYLQESVARLLRLYARLGPDLVVANSADTAAAAGGGTVLASPVEDRFFAVEGTEPTGGLRLVVVGRLAPWKGQDLAIEAFAKLEPAVASSLAIAGDALFGEDDFAAELRDVAARAGVADRVQFLGHVDDVAGLLAQIDVLVLSSRSPEPFGNVVVEAMAAGRTVLVPDRGGVTEFVIDDATNGNGYFYAQGDASSLAAKLRWIAAHPADRHARQERARTAAGAFRVPVVAAALVALYDDLLGRV